MAGLPPELDFKDREPLDKKRLDLAFGWLAGKIRALEAFAPNWVAAVNDLRNFGLQRINEAIMPAYQRVMNLASFGFLKAESTTSLALNIDAVANFVIDDEAQRQLFTPTAFVAVTRISTPDDWAIGRVLSYDAGTGVLTVSIISATVSPGQHDDWQITASAATLAASSKMLADARKAREDAGAIRTDTAAIRVAALQDIGAIRDAAVAARLAAEKAAQDANAAALLIAGGPVTTVNGENGAVTINADNLPGLEASLGQRLSIAAKQTLTAAQRLLGLENLGIFDGMLAPTGAVTHFYGTKAPKGWLKLNGALLSRSDFPELYAFALGSGGMISEEEWQAGSHGCFSIGTGQGNFRLPDVRGEFFRAWSDGAGVDSGRAFGSQQSDDFKSHGHTGTANWAGDHGHSAWTDTQGGHSHLTNDRVNRNLHPSQVGYGVTNGGTIDPNQQAWTNHTGDHGHNVGIGNAGGHGHNLTIAASGGEETRPRNIALLAIIKY